MLRRVAAAVATMAVAVFGVAALALAGGTGGQRFQSQVTINFTESKSFFGFHGKVKSERERCERRRRVAVWWKRAGPDSFIGSDKTDERGKWVVNLELVAVNQTYYAKAKGKEIPAGTCKRARSEDFFLDAGD